MRMVGDVLLINAAVLTSLMLRLLWIVAVGAPEAEHQLPRELWQYMTVYGDSSWMLTLICLMVFTL